MARACCACRDARFVNGIGRLQAGRDARGRGTRRSASVQQALGQEFPKTDAGWSVELRPLKDVRVGNAQSGLMLVFGAVASLWLMAVANIAGLMLAQVHRRSRELVLRAALGASRSARDGHGDPRGGSSSVCWAARRRGARRVAHRRRHAVDARGTTPRINELTMDWRALALHRGHEPCRGLRDSAWCRRSRARGAG